MGLFLGRLIFRGANYRRDFCVKKWVGPGNILTVHGLILVERGGGGGIIGGQSCYQNFTVFQVATAT